jgi:glucose/arabinose dehydrogenase
MCVAVLSIGLLAASPVGRAEAVPTGFVVRGQPSGQEAMDLTDFSYLPDDSILSTGKKGTVAWVSTDGRTRTIATLPVDSTQNLGLIGIAVAPDYAATRQIYLIRSVPGGTGGYLLRLARWTVVGAPEPTGLTDEQVIFEFRSPQPVNSMNSVVAAADGTLWVSIGDLSDNTRTDPNALQAMNLDAPNGKILHVTATGQGVANNPHYEPSNPSSWRSRVYASGFRNPFRLSLDPATGTPVVGDVGYNTWEEIDLVRPGQNYKWPCWEGNHPTPGYADLPQCASVVNTPPLWEYHHDEGSDRGNSVTGGIVYRGASYPQEYQGAYFFGDYAAQKLWTLRYDAQGNLVRPPESPPFATSIGGPVKFAAAPNGDIVFADFDSGALKRLSYARANSAPGSRGEHFG